MTKINTSVIVILTILFEWIEARCLKSIGKRSGRNLRSEKGSIAEMFQFTGDWDVGPLDEEAADCHMRVEGYQGIRQTMTMSKDLAYGSWLFYVLTPMRRIHFK